MTAYRPDSAHIAFIDLANDAYERAAAANEAMKATPESLAEVNESLAVFRSGLEASADYDASLAALHAWLHPELDRAEPSPEIEL